MSGRRHGRLPHQALFVRRLDASAAALDVARVSDRDAHVCYEVLRGYELQYTRVVGGVYSRVEGIRATRRCHVLPTSNACPGWPVCTRRVLAIGVCCGAGPGARRVRRAATGGGCALSALWLWLRLLPSLVVRAAWRARVARGDL